MSKVVDRDDELQSIVTYFRSLRSDRASFAGFLNLTDESPDLDSACLTFEVRDELIGNLIYNTLHGGIIASVLDSAGGHAVFLSIFRRIKGQPLEKQVKTIARIGSIDLRIDYLRPGKGKRFAATGKILRTGNKVAVTRMELHNEEGRLIAVGTGTYTVG